MTDIIISGDGSSSQTETQTSVTPQLPAATR